MVTLRVTSSDDQFKFSAEERRLPRHHRHRHLLRGLLHDLHRRPPTERICSGTISAKLTFLLQPLPC